MLANTDAITNIGVFSVMTGNEKRKDVVFQTQINSHKASLFDTGLIRFAECRVYHWTPACSMYAPWLVCSYMQNLFPTRISNLCYICSEFIKGKDNVLLGQNNLFNCLKLCKHVLYSSNTLAFKRVIFQNFFCKTVFLYNV